MTRNFSPLETCFVLCETKTLGELVGFLDLGDVDLNCATLPKVDNLVSCVMVFLIKKHYESTSMYLRYICNRWDDIFSNISLIW